MSTLSPEISVPDVFSEDDLLLLEIQVARRADELSLLERLPRGRDLVHWLRAEREILQRHRLHAEEPV
jgi:hypothetical protein